MKLMKHIMIALVLCAIPAVAFGQAGSADAVMVGTTCPAPCYTAPYFSGSGGFVAERANMDNPMTMDKDEGAVNFAVTCGNTTTTGSASVDDMGIARQVFSMANGLACGGMDGKIEIDNVKPGGWYWIHDDPNSAVASLVNVNVLGNSNMVMPTNPGGVTMSMMEGGAATFVKHEGSGRVGILGHIMATPDPAVCGGDDNVSNNCMLMASYSVGLMAGTTPADIGASVTRGGTDGTTDFDITASLGGSGFLKIVAADPITATFAITGAGSTATNQVATPGVTISGATITITSESAGRCAATNPDRGTPVGVVVTATASGNTLPALAAAGVSRSFSVMCPAPSSNAAQGQELVPENPFPVE